MQKWEYVIGRVSKNIDTENRKMDALGEMGYDLVSVDSGIAYFKRPIGFSHTEQLGNTKAVFSE